MYSENQIPSGEGQNKLVSSYLAKQKKKKKKKKRKKRKKKLNKYKSPYPSFSTSSLCSLNKRKQLFISLQDLPLTQLKYHNM